MSTHSRVRRVFAAYTFLIICCSAQAQRQPLRNAVTISANGWAFVGSSKYLGYGVEYNRQQTDWLGADAGFVALPSRQAAGTRTDYYGPGIAAAYGGLRLGRSFQERRLRVDMLFRGGSGGTRALQNVSSQGSTIDKLRTFPILGLGAEVSLRVSRHFSSTYTFVNDTTFFRPFTLILNGSPIQTVGSTEQTQEYKAGLRFHF